MPSIAVTPNSAGSDQGEATAPGPDAVAPPGQEAVPGTDQEAEYAADLDQFTPCDERAGGCDDEESEEFDGDAVAGLSAEPSLLEWAFDQYYTTKTCLLALTDKLETPEYRLIRTEQVRNIVPSSWAQFLGFNYMRPRSGIPVSGAAMANFTPSARALPALLILVCMFSAYFLVFKRSAKEWRLANHFDKA